MRGTTLARVATSGGSNRPTTVDPGRFRRAEEPRGEEEAVHNLNKTQEPEAVAPAVQTVCPLAFGNSDIFGGTYPDPTP